MKYNTFFQDNSIDMYSFLRCNVPIAQKRNPYVLFYIYWTIRVLFDLK